MRRDPQPVAPGWLSERIPEVRRLCAGARVRVDALWHSGLTDLHAKRAVQVELWYPGGLVREGLANLEWRPHPE